MMSNTCSLCGHNGHNSRTCTEAYSNPGGCSAPKPPPNGIMLFGVRLTTETSSNSSSFRKSVSMNNLSQLDQQQQQQQQDPNTSVDAGYASDDVVHASGSRSRERKRGVPWTEEEHKLFLLGLQKVGKGDWRGISRNFVKTRTPTQVASHAQKYFLRRTSQNRRRRRSSLFDIATDSFMTSSMEEDQESGSASQSGGLGMPAFSMTTSPVVSRADKPRVVRPVPIVPVPPSAKMANLNLNKKTPEEFLPLSLQLSMPSSEEWAPSGALNKIVGSGDGIVDVA